MFTPKEKTINLEIYGITPKELKESCEKDGYLKEKIVGHTARGLYRSLYDDKWEMHVIDLWVKIDASEEKIKNLLQKYMPTKFIT